jgi:hypothetical protein
MNSRVSVIPPRNNGCTEPIPSFPFLANEPISECQRTEIEELADDDNHAKAQDYPSRAKDAAHVIL